MPTRAQDPDRRLPAGVRAVDRAADLPRRGWDALAGPGDLFLTCRWLDVAEATAGVPMRYLWTERDGQPVAALATALATASAPWMLGRPDAVLRGSADAGLPGAAEFLTDLVDDPTSELLPALLAGGRHIGNTRILCGPSATEHDLAALVEAAESQAYGTGAAGPCFLYLGEAADPDRRLGALLAARGYESFVSGHYSVLRVPKDGYEGYLATLPRKRRVSVAAERRRVRAADVRTVLEPLADADLVRFAALEAELLEKYGIDWAPDQSMPVLRQARDVFGDDAFAAVARADGDIRGFALILRHGDHWYARQTGYDYAYQRRTGLPLYFELLYYRLVEEATAAGVSVIHYGLGSTDTKLSRGCTATEQRCHVLRPGSRA
ncbi:GNAT family N-acetyltransferase [Streptomyces sp. NPDC047869]|uniref:GNAT family N-acetyltransferase n=1 Tax=Streptomyces sp. NPDC047869 TaxID=3154709 RepID=UPI00345397AC